MLSILLVADEDMAIVNDPDVQKTAKASEQNIGLTGQFASKLSLSRQRYSL
jgi:hypothetical protein